MQLIVDELEKKLKEFLSDKEDNEITEEFIETTRKKLYEEVEQSKSGWTQNTVGFSLNEIRKG